MNPAIVFVKGTLFYHDVVQDADIGGIMCESRNQFPIKEVIIMLCSNNHWTNLLIIAFFCSPQAFLFSALLIILSFMVLCLKNKVKIFSWPIFEFWAHTHRVSNIDSPWWCLHSWNNVVIDMSVESKLRIKWKYLVTYTIAVKSIAKHFKVVWHMLNFLIRTLSRHK